MYRLIVALVAGLVGAAQANDECYKFVDCNACTGSAEAVNCTWCLNTKNYETGTRLDEDNRPPKEAAGQCSSSCPVDPDLPEAQQGSLGFKNTVVDITPNIAFDVNVDEFSGIDTNKVDIQLRRGSKATFKVRVKKGPVQLQLYFLLDLSDSMSEVFRAVGKSAGDTLPTAFDEFPTQLKPAPFLFGFGSFVDKAIPPFTFNRFVWNEANNRTPTYGFRHQVSFTTSNEIFAAGLDSIFLSGNDDAPEGGMEALVQALYCNQFVEWDLPGQGKPPVLRLVMMATDQTSHMAGDGQEAGIVWPAELKCHSQFFFGVDDLYVSQLMNPLTKRDTECKSKEFCAYHNVIHDYPSASQVGRALIDKQASVAFVVPASDNDKSQGVRAFYEAMSRSLGKRGAVVEQPITDDADDMDFTDIVRETYLNFFKQDPEFSVVQDESDVQFDTYYQVGSNGLTSCKHVDDFINVTVDGTTYFLIWECEFTVIAKKDPVTDAVLSTNVPLSQVHSSGSWGKFTINVVSSTCSCPTSNYFDVLPKNNESKDLYKCNGNGILPDENCGTCQCDVGAQGLYCDCDETNRWVQCLKAANGLECGGIDQGTCQCGVCVCKEPWTGPACNCKNECGDPDESTRCNGGTCNCDTCECLPGFTGPKCECNTNKACTDPDTESICNLRGTCNEEPRKVDSAGIETGCGCECDVPYEGEFCQECNVELSRAMPDGPDKVYCGDDQLCLPMKSCESCFAVVPGPDSTWNEDNGTFCQWCPGSQKCYVRERLVEAVENQEAICSDSDGNYSIYESILDCPVPPPGDITAAIVAPLAGLLALLLLALLLWRLLAHVQDQKEWKKFEDNRAKSKWKADNNPIFKSSVAEFENPVFEDEVVT